MSTNDEATPTPITYPKLCEAYGVARAMISQCHYFAELTANVTVHAQAVVEYQLAMKQFATVCEAVNSFRAAMFLVTRHHPDAQA